MAERRMFSKKIINSAKFLKMPVSTQALYFHLGLNADDDGIVEAYTVLKTTGATEDDLRVLTAKDFVIILNEDLVSYITDWNENNKLRADRKVDSIYKPLLLQVVPDASIKQPKPRADTKKLTGGQVVDQWTSNGQPMDGIGKDRIGKDSISKRFVPPTVEEVSEYCRERNNNVDAQTFVDFYSSKGWMVGKNKMKDWKAAVRTWEKKDREETEVKKNKYGY